MRIAKKWPHRSGDRLLKGTGELSELECSLGCVKTPVLRGAWRKKKKNSEERFDVHQGLINSMINYKLGEIGWKVQPTIDTRENPITTMKGDFSKSTDDGLRIFVEVEFGNVASMFRDLYKFNLAYSLDTYDCGVFVLPMKDIANRMDTVQDMNKAIKLIENGRDFINIPLLLVGISNHKEVDLLSIVDDVGYWKTQSKKKLAILVKNHKDELFDN